MNGGPSGFHNAPVTRTFVVASALLTVLLSHSLRLGLSYEDIFEKFRFWRLIVSSLAFSSTPELMFGLYLLYYFRVFERQIGSNKHSVFIVFSMMVSLLLEMLALTYLPDPSLKILVSGPYGLIFASFVPFYFDIPVSSRFTIFSLQLSDKSFIYLAGLQLLFSSWKRSLIPGICGVLAGSLYRLNAFGIRRVKFPDAFTNSLSRLSWPSGNSRQTSSSANVIGSIPSYPGHQVEGDDFFPTGVAVQEPLESAVATLVSMGFDSTSARHALVQARNDVNVATNILLEAQPR
ncbi:Rhomboid-like protein [Dioscorea alata]|uniref:Rhomboid-like protein n=2 Tax=Dioscorea alata TaxID=55571 RepID=A0ACB7TVL7_DIOAL|nr:Rhomboid-like protein [Dioscorea alata]KAH7652214.1 Rhomboid-like protein [Dioscorea alata]